MQTTRGKIIAGLVISAIPVLFLFFDTAIKLIKIPAVVESFTHLGFDPDIARGIGLLQLACLVVYLIPRTAAVGAVLLTGYLGGAICTHLRLGHPLLSHTLFPVYVAALLWLGLYLREPRVRALVARVA